jgi:hypothetical protein
MRAMKNDLELTMIEEGDESPYILDLEPSCKNNDLKIESDNIYYSYK